MAIHFIEEDRKIELEKRTKVKEWLKMAANKEGKTLGVVNYVFCSDEYLLGINKQFLGRDYLTDVISFQDEDSAKVSGDIIMSIDRIRENSAEMHISFDEELRRIMIHGLLHLFGYDDLNYQDKVTMTAREDFYLSLF